MKHLAKYLHDVTLAITETWCNVGGRSNATEHMDEATCLDCLREAAEYGREAEARLVFLESAAACKHLCAYECAHCNERRCWGCNQPCETDVVKTAVRYCPTHHEDGIMGRL